MRLIDRLFNFRFILILLSLLAAVAIVFTGVRFYKNYRYDKDRQAEKALFYSLLEESSFDEANEIWPSVYTYYGTDPDFVDEFSELMFEIYTDYYEGTYIESSLDDDAYEICRIYHSFLDTGKFDMVVSSIYEDYLYERIDYHTFIMAMNDYYLFSLYDSPKIVEILDTAAVILYSRESFYRGESKQRTGDYQDAIELYKNVPAIDVIYYPRAIENIDRCIVLLREQVRNGD